MHRALDQQLGRSLLERHIGWQITDKNENFLTWLSGRVDRRWGSLVVTYFFDSTEYECCINFRQTLFIRNCVLEPQP